jgi:hypothetical protein
LPSKGLSAAAAGIVAVSVNPSTRTLLPNIRVSSIVAEERVAARSFSRSARRNSSCLLVGLGLDGVVAGVGGGGETGRAKAVLGIRVRHRQPKRFLVAPTILRASAIEHRATARAGETSRLRYRYHLAQRISIFGGMNSSL